MWELLEEIKAKLQTIPEFDTVAIGTEKGIGSKDCPAVRVVLDYRERDTTRNYFDHGNIQIIILLDLKNDLEALYEQSITLEEKVRSLLNRTLVFTRTEYDGDSVSAMKVTILNFGFKSVQNDTSYQCG